MKALVLALLVSVLFVGEVTAQMTQALHDKVVSEHNRLRRDAIGLADKMRYRNSDSLVCTPDGIRHEA